MKASPAIAAERVAALLTLPASRQVVWETTRGDGWDHGVQWLWLRGAEFYTAAGLARLVAALRATGCEADALTLAAELPKPEAQPGAPDPARSPSRRRVHHLPYADADDQEIFNAQFSAPDARPTDAPVPDQALP